MARTSGAVGGIAARVAGRHFLGIRTDKAAHAEDLKAILGGLKGPLMKVAQFLSTVPDALPEEYAQQLATLQANAPPMGWSFVRRRMAGELGPGWERRFRSFGKEAAAAASLGQVHRATLPDGREVACKLQYPDMPSVVEADLRQLKLAMNLYRRMDSSLDHEEVYAEIAERMREELDYKREAAQMRLYGIMLDGVPGVRVPAPVEELCTRRLLTMNWLDGRAILRRWRRTRRRRSATPTPRRCSAPGRCPSTITASSTATRISATTRCGRTRRGARHQPARFRHHPRLPAANSSRRHHAVRSGARRRRRQGGRGLRDLGLRGPQARDGEVLNLWARFLYEPLLEDRVRPIQETNDRAYGRKIAEQGA